MLRPRSAVTRALRGIWALLRQESPSYFIAVVWLNILGLTMRLSTMAMLIIPLQLVLWRQTESGPQWLDASSSAILDVTLLAVGVVCAVIIQQVSSYLFERILTGTVGHESATDRRLRRNNLMLLVDLMFVVSVFPLLTIMSIFSGLTYFFLALLAPIAVVLVSEKRIGASRESVSRLATLIFGLAFALFAIAELSNLSAGSGTTIYEVLLSFLVARLGLQKAARLPLRRRRPPEQSTEID